MNHLPARVAADLMQRHLITARPDQLLAEVRHLLIESHITGLPVVDGQRLVGVLSRSDLARMEDLLESLDGEVSADQTWLDQQADGFQHATHSTFGGFRQRLAALRVRDAMRSQVITCGPQTPLAEVAREMVEQHVHRVVVVENDRAVGIISALDFARLAAEGG